MTDGRVYTLEDEIDVIHEDLGRARRYLDELDRAESERRIADPEQHAETRRGAVARVQALEVALREACAQQIAASEGLEP